MITRGFKSLDELQPGMWLRHWHDTGCFGMKPIYCRVVRVNRRSLTVKSELQGGIVKRVHVDKLHIFERTEPGEAEAVLRDEKKLHLFEVA